MCVIAVGFLFFYYGGQ